MRLTAIVIATSLACTSAAQVAITDFLSTGPSAGFERAEATRPFVFPADHAAHPRFRSEWWYFSGNLQADDKRHFGFQLTLFRFALAPEPPKRDSAWATNQAWMAHFTITDSAGRRFHAAERLARGALGLAGAEAAPFRVWLGDWRAASSGDAFFPLRLAARDGEFAIDLMLTATKPLVPQGEDGLDRKGPEPGNASYYYSYTRLAATGRMQTGGSSIEVSGSAWIDREWSTSALGRDLAGWDWIALQFSDGSEMMLYRLRRRDGGASRFSKAALIQPDGTRIAIAARDFELLPQRWWTSPKTGTQYPVAWSLRVPSLALELDIEPTIDDQELDLSVRYWEGAITASGHVGQQPLEAQGYLELAGY